MSKIKIGIVGHGNLGRGVELAVAKQPDMELVAIFTRRPVEQIQPITSNVSVYSMSELAQFVGKVDVMILCGGSATDLPEQTPAVTKLFNTVDSFDTHANIPAHFEKVNQVAVENKTVSVISSGWDPGLFSLNRVLFDSVLMDSVNYTFWGKGVSQGHSDAIRRIDGVLDAKQYTIPRAEAVEAVRSGQNPTLTTRQKHLRECYVVVNDSADKEQVRQAIVTMPNYFDEYDTTVHFVSQEVLNAEHAKLPHGGFVMTSGSTSSDNQHLMEFHLQLDSNPEFTASVLVASARAAFRLSAKGESGAKTLFDIPVGLLSVHSAETLRQNFL